ncbi:hypothetical protein GCM10010246_84900 [Streptomyces cuspidosporus]|uniref:Uncharacterized protein n=1 Tax=Streptomyces cuspidosporus TaxID=66882 RepID=A0ABP5UFX3_9ACTN
MVCDFRFAHSIPMLLPMGSPLLRRGTIRLVSAALFEMHDEWIALPRQHLPEGDMGESVANSLLVPPRYPTYRNTTSS